MSQCNSADNRLFLPPLKHFFKNVSISVISEMCARRQFPPALHFVTRQSHQEKHIVRIKWRKVSNTKFVKTLNCLPSKISNSTTHNQVERLQKRRGHTQWHAEGKQSYWTCHYSLGSVFSFTQLVYLDWLCQGERGFQLPGDGKQPSMEDRYVTLICLNMLMQMVKVI